MYVHLRKKFATNAWKTGLVSSVQGYAFEHGPVIYDSREIGCIDGYCGSHGFGILSPGLRSVSGVHAKLCKRGRTMFYTCRCFGSGKKNFASSFIVGSLVACAKEMRDDRRKARPLTGKMGQYL